LPKSPAINLFRATAHLFDLDTRDAAKDDIPFYLQYAARLNANILELACGTGRVTIPLAKAGHHIWGLDLSLEMLNEFKKKLPDLPLKISERIDLTHADMCDFDLNMEFSLIIIPFRSFQALITHEQQRLCLNRVYRHLSNEGLFILNVFRPYAYLDRSWISEERFDWETIDPRTGCKVRRNSIRRDIDVENQILYSDLIYYVADPEGKEERLIEPLVLKYYYENQFRELILSSDFKIKEEMGYYDKRPIKEGPELILVCGK